MRLPWRRRRDEWKWPKPPRGGLTARRAAPNRSTSRRARRRVGRLSLLPHALPEDVSRAVGGRVAATGLSPNALTVLGLVGAGGAAALAAGGHFWQAGLVMLAAGLFDLLDGAVARARGRATTWGAIFDAVSDRLGEFAMFLGLLVWFTAAERFDREAVMLIGVSSGGALLVSYTRSKAGEFGVRIRAGLGTRLERMVILAIGLFANEVVAVLWILAVLTNLTAAQRLAVTWWALRGDAAAGPDGPDAEPAPAESVDSEPLERRGGVG